LKIIFKILIYLLFLSSYLYSKDTLAVISTKDFYLITKDSLQFDIYLSKNSDDWNAFANSTLQLYFLDTMFVADSSDFIFDYKTNTSDLPIFTSTGNQIPIDSYLIEPKVFKNRFSITIIGPEKYDDCQKLSLGQTIKLGTFSIKSKSKKNLPNYLKWLEPIYWYQAVVYKRDTDSLINNSIPFYYKNDNISMDDGKNLIVKYNIEHNPEEYFNFDNFWVIYTGQKIDSLGWSTKLEKDVNGYFIKRGVRTNIFEIEYSDLIGTWVANDPKYNPDYVSKGYSKTGHIYNPFYDTVYYRGGEYCYSLWANMNRKDGTTYDTLLASKCITVPNAVISKANPLTNPFSSSTIISLDLDDDCYVDGFVTDEIGNFVTQLTYNGKPMDKLMMKIGKNYSIPFNASSIASQGLYNAVFIAHPINDINIELSKAVVKLQLVKDGSK